MPRTVTAPPPPPQELRVARRTVADVAREIHVRRRGGAPLPPGSTLPSVRNTWSTFERPLELLLDHEARFGPVFTIRTAHEAIVWAIGAEVNHQILVSDADAFTWRHGRYTDLAFLLGNGMLNIDGAYHRQLRKVMLPSFHREQVAGVADDMVAEAVAAADRLRDGQRLDVYAWTRELALRIALRALLGMRAGGREVALAHAFEDSLGLFGHPLVVQMLRGPRTPYARALRARATLDALVAEEIRERRAGGDPGRGVLGLLLATTDEDGRPLPDAAVRDQTMTLLFAGHDTTTATLTFLLHELGRNAGPRQALLDELDATLGGADPQARHLGGDALPVLERTLDETLRRYPAAWIGPRRVARTVTLAGVPVPAGIGLHYSSWATHHLESLWPDPFRFDPDRFLPERAATIPKGAYIPFGGGSRTCLGKRFGQTELRALAAVLLTRFAFEPDSTADVPITTTPTLGPKGGLTFTLRAR